jgi:hypothetical protein
MRQPQVNYGWNPIESAPLDEDVTVQVTDGRGAPYTLQWPCRRTANGWINFEEGNGAGGHAGAVEAVPWLAPFTMTPRRFPTPWRAEPIPGGYVVATLTGRRSANSRCQQPDPDAAPMVFVGRCGPVALRRRSLGGPTDESPCG